MNNLDPKSEQWISVKDKLPETETQHRTDFESEKVAVWTDEGLSTDRYVRRFDSTSNGLAPKSEGWLYESGVTHWKKINPPNL